MEFQDKVSIITGGAKGIGKSIVESLFKEGSHVVIWDLDDNEAVALKTKLKAKYKRINEILIQKIDVTDPIGVQAAIKEILRTLKSVDILVNNAGLYSIYDITAEDESNWDKIINVNLKSAFLCIKAVLPIMIKNRYGKIVNISSISGKKESIFASPSYCASKAGLIGLTRCVAAQTAKYGINVNCVAPGITDTGMISLLNGKKLDKAMKIIPLRRICTPEDVANAVSFLVRDESNYITGETVNVNGGGFME
jgi:NAD(P)-dependent dehydrogenase (short-subunit alcohol dehydrogenase family)